MTMPRTKHTVLARGAGFIGLVLILLLFTMRSAVQAITPGDLYSINTNTSFFDPTASAQSCSIGAGSGGLTAADGTDTPKWHTTLQPPYSLEDFIVELLRDIAAKEGVPETNTVTQQHVLALMAFAYGEGGNLTNDDIYNPWNTGYTGPDLQPVGGHSSSGVQSYASFDDGVEATARVMTGTGGSGGYQSRLGATLKDPTTTADQFMKALTYYQNYQNNKEWAEASMPPNQDSYYHGRLQLIQTVESGYTNIASLVIGPPGNSANNDQHSPHQLRYSFNGSSTTPTASGDLPGTSACDTGAGGGGVVAGDIVATAVGLAWDDVTFPSKGANDSPSCTSADPAQNPTSCHHGFQQMGVGQPTTYTRQTYQDAWAKYNKADSTNFTDCGVFVATVLRASGVATDYPASGSSTQLQWARQHPDKYTVIDNPNLSDLQPGDIMVNSEHTFIYVGKQADGYSVAEASQFNHAPEIDNVPANEGAGFSLVRVKK